MKKIALIVAIVIANAAFACSECKDTGIVSFFVPCEHCKGTGLVSTGSSSGVTSYDRKYLVNLRTGAETTTSWSMHIKCATVAKRCLHCSTAKSGYLRKKFPCWKCNGGPKPLKVPKASLIGTKNVNTKFSATNESAYSTYVKEYKRYQLD